MTKNNEDMLSLRVARSGTKRQKYGRFVPAAPQCLLMFSAIVHNLIYMFWEFRNYLRIYVEGAKDGILGYL